MLEGPAEDRRLWGSEGQRDLLVRFCETFPLAEKFFLTGGTALGVFYLWHRVSEDVDLFTTEEVDLLEHVEALRDVVRPRQVLAERSPSFLSYVSDEGVKVDFVVDHLSAKGGRPRVEMGERVSLSVDTLENIAINKICAVVSRGEARDVVDLFFLLKADRGRFPVWFAEARRREALLDDLLYVTAAFERLAEGTEGLLDEIHGALRRPLDPEEFRRLWLELAEEVERELQGH